MKIIETIRTRFAQQVALAFSACLAADKGVASKIETRSDGYLVVADDGLAIMFLQVAA